MKLLALSILLVSTIVFTGCDSKEQNQETSTNKIELNQENSSSFTLTTTKGIDIEVKKEEVNLYQIAGYEGKVVLLNFFATWCPPCKAEIPHLNNLKKNYKDQFEIIAVLLEDGKTNPQLEEFISEYNITYPVVNGSDNFKLASVIGNVKNIPTMFLLNTDGKIVQKYVGVVPEEMLASDIKRALKK